jgi:Zn-finger nucleic acid-binding protein
MVIAGSKFCSHCGTAILREEVPAGKVERCPRCRIPMQSVLIGKTNLRECSYCEGIWADAVSLQQICADREQQSAVLGTATALPVNVGNIEKNIRYIPCPVCTKLMNRVMFARCSGVVVDVCKAHGTWFDKDELRRIVEFIRAGGMDAARADEMEQLEEKRRQLKAAEMARASDPIERTAYYNRAHNGIADAAANLLTSFFFD